MYSPRGSPCASSQSANTSRRPMSWGASRIARANALSLSIALHLFLQRGCAQLAGSAVWLRGSRRRADPPLGVERPVGLRQEAMHVYFTPALAAADHASSWRLRNTDRSVALSHAERARIGTAVHAAGDKQHEWQETYEDAGAVPARPLQPGRRLEFCDGEPGDTGRDREKHGGRCRRHERLLDTAMRVRREHVQHAYQPNQRNRQKYAAPDGQGTVPPERQQVRQ